MIGHNGDKRDGWFYRNKNTISILGFFLVISGLIFGILALVVVGVPRWRSSSPSVTGIANNETSSTALKDSKSVVTIGTTSRIGAPDYITDGADDNVQFQQALDALPASGGRIIVLAGNYRFSNVVSRATNNVTIEGVGKTTSITRNGANPIFSAGSQNKWNFRNMRLDAGGVNISKATLWTMENVYIGNSYYAVRTTDNVFIPPLSTQNVPTLIVAASDASEASRVGANYVTDGINDEEEINEALVLGNVKLTEGTFYRQPGVPISVPSNRWLRGEGQATKIINTKAWENLGKTITNSDNIGGSSNIHISDLFIDSANVGGGYGSYGIALFNTTRSTIEHVWINGETSTQTLIYLDRESSRNIVRNNHLWDSALQHIASFGDSNIIIDNDITASPIFGGEGTTISGDYNIISDNSYKNVGDTLNATEGASHFSFVGNVLVDNTVNSIALYEDSHYGTIIGNIIQGVGNNNTGQSGIYISNNSDGHLIVGNTLIQTPGYGAKGDSYGIRLALNGPPKPSDIVIQGNEIRNWKDFSIFAYGEPAYPMYRITITGNTIASGNSDGIYADNLQDSIISGNSIENNSGNGIWAYNAKDTLITGNRLTGNGGVGISVLVLASEPTWVPAIANNVCQRNVGGDDIMVNSTDPAALPREAVKERIKNKSVGINSRR